MSDKENVDEMGCGAVAGFQAPLTDEDRMNAVRELVRQRVKEVVRKKPGGGGYVLYSPNKGKKDKPKSVGTFPTMAGAKQAELSRFPPKDPSKLARLRANVIKAKKSHKNESVMNPAQGGVGLQSPGMSATSGVKETVPTKTHNNVNDFMSGLKALPRTGPDRGKYVTSHMHNADFLKSLKAHPQGSVLFKQMTDFMNSKQNAGIDATHPAKFRVHRPEPTVAPSAAKQVASEAAERRVEFMDRTILSKIVSKSLVESLFREEKTESEWDDYISKLSKQTLANDPKFQKLHSNISKKTESILDDAFNTIRKAVGKSVKLKSFGLKHDQQTGQTYLAFSASFDNVAVEPIYIYIDGGVPKIHLDGSAKAALTKIDPHDAKMFRAELVQVQEGILDEMDDLAKSIQSRDKYLEKMEADVDVYVAGLTPLQISLLKRLLVAKYRKI